MKQAVDTRNDADWGLSEVEAPTSTENKNRRVPCTSVFKRIGIDVGTKQMTFMTAPYEVQSTVPRQRDIA